MREAERAEREGNRTQFDRSTSLQNHIANSFSLGTQEESQSAKQIEPEVEFSDAFTAGNANVFVRNVDDVNECDDAPIIDNDTLETNVIERTEIKKQPQSWYKFLCTPGTTVGSLRSCS